MGFIKTRENPHLSMEKDNIKEVVDELFRFDKKSIHLSFGDWDSV